jgi:NitT/TauT family transport system substrate-binding protein
MTTGRRHAGWAVAAVGIIVALSSLAGSAGAQPRPPERLRVGTAGIEPGMGGLWMAKDAGFFDAFGLDVEFVVFASGTQGIQALLSGQLPIVTAGGPAVVHAVLAGADVRCVAELLGTMPARLFVSPSIASPADLKGKMLGISKFGTVSDFAVRFALSRWGLEPDRDVTLIQVGTAAGRLAAVQSGSVAGTVLDVGLVDAARKVGLRELADLSTLGLSFPYEVVAVPQSLIRERPDTLRRFLQAVTLGVRRFKTDREAGIRVLAKYLQRPDPEGLADTYTIYAGLVPAKPFVTPEGLRFVLGEIGRTNPRAKLFTPAQFVDEGLLRELDRSGFLDHPSVP